MSRSPSPTLQKGSVRNIISIFETQAYNVNNEVTKLVRRAVSMGSLVERPRVVEKSKVVQKTAEPVNERVFVEPERGETNLELIQIEQEIRHLQKNLLNNYKTYSRDNHIYYQNQIIFILTDLANLQTRNDVSSAHKKSELTEDLKKLNKKLNGLLPSGGQVVATKSTVVNSTPVVKKPTKEKTPVMSESSERKVENVRPPSKEKQREKVIQKREAEEDEGVAISVKSLKQRFEINSNQKEKSKEARQTKITRKSATFNSSADHKYVPYKEIVKSKSKSIKRKVMNFFDNAIQSSFNLGEAMSDDEREGYSKDSLSERSSSDEEYEQEKSRGSKDKKVKQLMRVEPKPLEDEEVDEMDEVGNELEDEVPNGLEGEVSNGSEDETYKEPGDEPSKGLRDKEDSDELD